MKKTSIIILVAAVLVGVFFVSMMSTEVDFKTQGIRTFIKEEQENSDMKVDLKLSGAIYDPLFFGESFVGDLTINEAVFKRVEFKIGKESLLYGELENGDPVFIGDIYTDQAFRQVVIVSRDLGDEGEPLDKGVIIAGPALNRDEAIEITKELLIMTDSRNIELLE